MRARLGTEPRLPRRLVTFVSAWSLLLSASLFSAPYRVNPGASSQRGPTTAPITILEFSDFECPHCAQMSTVVEQLIKQYPDQIRVLFKHLPSPIHKQAPLAHEAALAAGGQGKFWEMHDLLFADQTTLSRPDLERRAQRLGLDLDKFRRALDSHEYGDVLSRDRAEAAALGVGSTPTLFINGRKVAGAVPLATMETFIDSLLGRPPKPVSASLLNADKAPSRGAPTAPVTIVAFSDFQCPFCAKVIPALNEVLAKYQGRVRLAFKHFPLDMHPNAPLAHRAALAAGEQGKFWEMHDALFARQDQATRPGLVAMARGLGLDVARFESDLTSDRFKATIERDTQDGNRLEIDGTPAFFINGVRLSGAQPAAAFSAAIDRELARLRGEAAPANSPRPSATATVSDRRSIGPPGAPVTVMWFGDLRSALHVEASRLIKQLLATRKDLRVQFRHVPAAGRTESQLAYDVALAAAAQGRFWEMLDLLAADQSVNTVDAYLNLGKRLGLDPVTFEKDLRERPYRSIGADDLVEGQRLNVRGTPTFFVNQERVDGIPSIEKFRDIVDRHSKGQSQQ